MDIAPSGSALGAWLRNPGQLPGASKDKMLLRNFTHGTPGSQNLSDTVKLLVRSLWWVTAREVPWVGLGRSSGPSQTKICPSSPHTAPQGPRIYPTRLKDWLGSYVKFQPVGWPGWAWGGLCEVWREGDKARGPRGGLRQKLPVFLCACLCIFWRLCVNKKCCFNYCTEEKE